MVFFSSSAAALTWVHAGQGLAGSWPGPLSCPAVSVAGGLGGGWVVRRVMLAWVYNKVGWYAFARAAERLPTCLLCPPPASLPPSLRPSRLFLNFETWLGGRGS